MDKKTFIIVEGKDLKEGGLSDYIKMRADRERRRRQELEEKYGDEFPLNVFNPTFIFATAVVLGNLKEESPESLEVLLAKLKDPQAEISEEFFEKITKHGTLLVKQEDGSYKADVLVKALFRETEKLDNGFIGYIEKVRKSLK